jgi:hypothetical protein
MIFLYIYKKKRRFIILKDNKRSSKDQPGQKLAHGTFKLHSLIHLQRCAQRCKNKKINTLASQDTRVISRTLLCSVSESRKSSLTELCRQKRSQISLEIWPDTLPFLRKQKLYYGKFVIFH